jgi:hypothetical protein
MALFKKKADPISDRARALSHEIADLEVQIQRLDSELHRSHGPAPRLRSPALPHGTTPHRVADTAATSLTEEPIFEQINQNRLNSRGDIGTTPEHYNDLGVRKYDLPALLRKLGGHFRGPSTTNPKLVNYLAAGGIHGLRPLRYEKRVARNRFLLLVAIILSVLLGIVLVVAHRPH